jgi:hypothetical protein
MTSRFSINFTILIYKVNDVVKGRVATNHIPPPAATRTYFTNLIKETFKMTNPTGKSNRKYLIYSFKLEGPMIMFFNEWKKNHPCLMRDEYTPALDTGDYLKDHDTFQITAKIKDIIKNRNPRNIMEVGKARIKEIVMDSDEDDDDVVDLKVEHFKEGIGDVPQPVSKQSSSTTSDILNTQHIDIRDMLRSINYLCATDEIKPDRTIKHPSWGNVGGDWLTHRLGWYYSPSMGWSIRISRIHPNDTNSIFTIYSKPSMHSEVLSY